MLKTRADRGDLYTLTAATFTVLTGFTRAGPAGPGTGKLCLGHETVKSQA